MIKTIFLVAGILLGGNQALAGGNGNGTEPNDSVISFKSAKKKLYSKLYNNQGQTFYCSCDWSNRKVDLKSCGLQSFFPKKHRKRALRTEAEHIIPASWFLKKERKFRQCAIDAKIEKESARKYCQKNDLEYKKAHNDLVNLMPAVGQINAERSNKPFLDNIRNDRKTYGRCDIVIGSRGISPPADKKGDIARVAFYMSETYGVEYSKRQNSLFVMWDKQDPVSIEERLRNRKIVRVQGYGIIQ